ncbi:A-kinase anchor protein 200 [Ricinus communis]|uniref:Uncharacterized protein n=1 Tax=Ricinus communis TaxID=3988 RepID=B9S1Z0_RICCO|nr:A-kinase anchor protein 200 [Ricinus communis]EEF42333.1 conserved hypothetical protein [Ricinus communis]|eukprot:XP_002520009.1 uncharacterized protein LOC8283067 [Ricinus communis]
MDFHSLARKELQALCKKNKIPANMTNVAMADALKALEKVDGLDEVINAPRSDPQQSPEKTGNPEPRTVCRTSTRRKPINVEPESSQLPTRTRRTTKKTSAAEEAEQENNNENLLETPAVSTSRRRVTAASARRKIDTQLMESVEDEKAAVGEEKSDVPETPAIRSSRSKAPVVSTKKKIEEKSVQRVYGTRHSVRLLEKSLADLSVKEKRTVEVVKIEGLCEETDHVEQQKGVPGGDSEIDESLENEGELKHEFQEENKTITDHEVTDYAKLEIGSESCTNLDSHSGLDAEDKDDDSSGESLLRQVETSDRALDMNDEPIHENGPDVVITENSHSVTAALEPETEREVTDNQDSLVAQVSDDSVAFIMEADHISIVNATDEVSDEVVDLVTPKVSEVEGQVSMEVRNLSEVVSECSKMNSKEDEVHGSYDMVTENSETVIAALEPEIEKEMIENRDSLVVQASDDSAMETEHISIVNAATEVSVEVVDLLNPKVSEVEGQVCVEVMDLSAVVGESSEMNSMEDKQHLDAASEEDSDGDDIEEESDGYETDSICDSNVTEAKESAMIAQEFSSSSDSDNTPRSVKQKSPFCSLIADSEVPAEECAHDSIQTLDKSPYKPLVSGDTSTGSIVSSPFAINTIQVQFPRPTALTPKKSSTKKQATIQKIILADINKENIDNSGRKVEPKKNKTKKQNNYEGFSLNKLRKEFKELRIAKNNNGGRNVSEVETRSALQILPEN